jgi:hypothetical protein
MRGYNGSRDGPECDRLSCVKTLAASELVAGGDCNSFLMNLALSMMVERGETSKQYKFQRSEMETIRETVRVRDDDEATAFFIQTGE